MTRLRGVKLAGLGLLMLSTLFCSFGPTQIPPTQPVNPKPVATAKPPTTQAPAGPAYALVESDPPGALVEVGMKSSGGVIQPGSGRVVGNTPVKVELKPSDVVMTGSNGNIYFRLIRTGYFESVHVLGLGSGGKLEPGKIYPVYVKMKAL